MFGNYPKNVIDHLEGCSTSDDLLKQHVYFHHWPTANTIASALQEMRISSFQTNSQILSKVLSDRGMPTGIIPNSFLRVYNASNFITCVKDKCGWTFPCGLTWANTRLRYIITDLIHTSICFTIYYFPDRFSSKFPLNSMFYGFWMSWWFILIWFDLEAWLGLYVDLQLVS